MNEADLIYKTKYSEALRYGALTAAEAQKIIDDRQIFTAEDTANVKELFFKLHRLGEELMKEERFAPAADIIFKMEEVRGDIMRINMRKNNILDNTAESYADEHRLQFYTVACTFHEDDQPVYKDVDEYLEYAETELAKKALVKVIHLIANDGKDFRLEWPEFQWRIKHGLMDDNLNTIQEKVDAAVKSAQSEIENAANEKVSQTTKKKTTKKKRTSRKKKTT
jgi:hypothetical protein